MLSFLGERDYFLLILLYQTHNTAARRQEALTVYQIAFKAYYRYYLPCYYKEQRAILFLAVAFRKLTTLLCVKTIIMLTKA